MKSFPSKRNRILALAPSVHGVGFAVLDPKEMLVDWGVKSVKGEKNKVSLSKVKEMIVEFEPGFVVVENTAVSSSRRSPRVRTLFRQILVLVRSKRLRVSQFTPELLRQAFQVPPDTTKDALAEILAARFPGQLGLRLPPKRRAWMKTHYRMCIFEAVALALAAQKSALQ